MSDYAQDIQALFDIDDPYILMLARLYVIGMDYFHSERHPLPYWSEKESWHCPWWKWQVDVLFFVEFGLGYEHTSTRAYECLENLSDALTESEKAARATAHWDRYHYERNRKLVADLRHGVIAVDNWEN